jgi:hypothetical protein
LSNTKLSELRSRFLGLPPTLLGDRLGLLGGAKTFERESG